MEQNELQNQLAQEEKRLRAAYYYLGREYSKLLSAGAAPAVPGLEYLVEKAGEFQANIDRIQAQLAAPAAPVCRFCTSCGARLDPNAAFCTECGAKQ